MIRRCRTIVQPMVNFRRMSRTRASVSLVPRQSVLARTLPEIADTVHSSSRLDSQVVARNVRVLRRIRQLARTRASKSVLVDFVRVYIYIYVGAGCASNLHNCRKNSQSEYIYNVYLVTTLIKYMLSLSSSLSLSLSLVVSLLTDRMSCTFDCP